MDEDPKIIPDAPPASPVDVQVTPDSPPAVPFDVRTYPDGPPGPTFDVRVTPDAGPRAPIDVAVDPDPGPASPFDVPVSPDGPPTVPFQVDLTPDGPPAVPINVTVAADLPPAAPFNVPTYPDLPPAVPFNVAITPDGPPAAPFDVTIVLDPRLAAPPNPDVIPDHPPALVLPNPTQGKAPTIDEIINAVQGFDHTLGSFLAGLAEINPISVGGPGGGALNPQALAKWLKDYTDTVGGGGVAKFIAEQGVLYGMNPVAARIFDPTYFLKMLVPGSMGHVTTTVDAEFGQTMRTAAESRDTFLKQVVGINPNRPAGDGSNDRPDVYGPENTLLDGQEFTVDALVEGALGEGNPYLKTEQSPAGGTISRFDATTCFGERDGFGATLAKPTAKEDAASGITNAFRSKLAQSNALDGIIRVPIRGEGDDGTVLSPSQDPSGVVDDDDARVPIVFTDLRKDPVSNSYRSVYFRPINLSFSNAISPEYSEASTFGRVDSVIGYQKTGRTFNVGFEVHAFAPEDLEVMYNKMVWLSSMCYPSFDADSLLRSGPVIRMRIGDVVSTDLGGLPGVIRSLNFDFADALWELKAGMKVPRSFKVSLDFLTLHDGPVGILDGVFGVLQLPAGVASGDTNFAGNPTAARDAGVPERASSVPRMFARFGEPRR